MFHYKGKPGKPKIDFPGFLFKNQGLFQAREIRQASSSTALLCY